MIEKISRDLVLLAQATPTDKLTWQPMGEGRSILNQLIECAFANRKWTLILREGAYRTLTDAERASLKVEPETCDNALRLLQKTTVELTATIRALPDEVMGGTWPLEWSPSVTRTVAEACFHAYWNMAYHEGQISYIQTLYGDQEEHTDGGPFGE
jgi:uncharacterized damage-inducible protein DinB